jgi:hypothetical protein
VSKWGRWLDSRLPSNAAPSLVAIVDLLKQISAFGDWTPSDGQADSVWNSAVHLGYSRLFYSFERDVDHLVDRLVGQLMRHGRFRQQDLAELDGGAVLGSMGANLHWKIQEDKKHRVPDFIVAWIDDIEGDELPAERVLTEKLCAVEVTSAKQKQINVDLMNFSSRLCRRMMKLRMCRFELFIAGFLTRTEIRALFRAATEGSSGSKASAGGRWELAIDDYVWREGGFTVRNERYALPSWWKGGFDVGGLVSGPMRIRITEGKFAGTDSVDNPSVVHFPFKHDRYLNSIQGKAERFQGAIGAPFIILLDASNLPDFTPGLRAELERKFPEWPHVTAVIAFRRMAVFPRYMGFEAIYVNPHAAHPLPKEAAAKVPGSNFGYKSWCEEFLRAS